MGWQKALILSTVGLGCAYAGFLVQEKWIRYERSKRENYLDSEVERRLKEAENESNPPAVPAEPTNSTELKE